MTEMYDDLIKRLREGGNWLGFSENVRSLFLKSADAIEKLQMAETSDNVNHPSHYTQGGIECIEAIKASFGNADFASYCKGNVLKYLWRYRHKAGVEDLQKAKVYLDWMIQAEKEIQEANNAQK